MGRNESLTGAGETVSVGPGDAAALHRAETDAAYTIGPYKVRLPRQVRSGDRMHVPPRSLARGTGPS